MGNLLSNAARHSPESSAIRVSAAQKGVHVEVCVADDGVGISAERLPYLFRKFSRHDGDDGGSGLLGSGLGLAICKGIVEAHGGRIWAESDGPGMGARFTFTLPRVEEPGPAPALARSGRVGRNRVRVLAVDDDPQTLRYVRDALTEAGYVPIVTGDPDAVGRLMEEERPNLVLLDLMLPRTDGIELMESVPELSDVPVIFLSAYGRDQIVARALESGADDYIVKPFSPTELVARIQTVMRRRTATESAEPSDPYVLGDLTVNYVERRVTLAGRPVQLSDIEYRMLLELSVNAGSGAVPRPASPTGLGSRTLRSPRGGADRREEHPPEAGGRRQQSHLHPQRASRRLPHGQGGDGVGSHPYWKIQFGRNHWQITITSHGFLKARRLGTRGVNCTILALASLLSTSLTFFDRLDSLIIMDVYPSAALILAIQFSTERI